MALAGGALLSGGSLDHTGGRPGTAPSLSHAQTVQGGLPSSVTGRAHVRDGDTIEVGRVPVRLQGLHCPELGEPGGRNASIAMQRLTRGNEVRCSLTGERSYDRKIGICRVGDTDLAAALIRERVCARCPRYDPGMRYAAAQQQAGGWTLSMPGYCR